MAPNNMAQRFKMTGFVFNIFIIMIQYIIIINSSDKINIMKQHIGKIDENKTNYNFEDRFDKFDNFVIKMVIRWFWLKYENIFYKNRFQHYFFRQHLDHYILGDDYLKKILSNQALLFSIDGKILNPT